MVVDSSVWLELLRQGPLHQKCQKAIHRQHLRVPTVVLFEVYRKLKAKVSEDVALEAIAVMSQHEVLPLERDVALLAGDLALEHHISMADAFVLAHAEHLKDTLLTLDNDFSEMPHAKVLR